MTPKFSEANPCDDMPDWSLDKVKINGPGLVDHGHVMLPVREVRMVNVELVGGNPFPLNVINSSCIQQDLRKIRALV